MTEDPQRLLRVLIIDDSHADARLLTALVERTGLASGGIEVVHCLDAESGAQRLREGGIDCVFLDYVLEGLSGGPALQLLRQVDPFVAVIGVSADGGQSAAVDLMKNGALDYEAKNSLTTASIEERIVSSLQRAELARAMSKQQEELGAFASVAAHDLASPLRHLKFATRRLREELADTLAGESEKYFGILESTTNRMDALLKALLGYAQSGRSSTGFIPVDLSALLEEVLSGLEEDLGNCEAVVHREPLPTILGCPASLGQLLGNLLGNAIKYRGQQAPRISVSASVGDDEAVLGVHDNGIGFDSDYAVAVFEPFRRLHGNRVSGSGIGLATCKRIVEQHGGRIWAESSVGAGASIYVAFPRASVVGSPRVQLVGDE